MTLETLLKHASSGRGLISTASPYFKDLRNCLSDACPTKALGVDESKWEEVIKEADERLTYSDPLGLVDLDTVKSFTAEKGWGDLDEDSIPEKSIMVFDSVLSTSDTDREGDILYTEGMDLEKSMPVLWQHVWHQPIGVQIRTLEQNSSRVVVREAIGDTPLGKDASVLIGMGAMRKSHGFMPTPGEIILLGVQKEGDTPTGFGIKKCKVYESSVVSVPANAGAQILSSWEKEYDGLCKAFSRKLLSTDLANKWAENLYEKRSKVFSGATPGADKDTSTCGCQKGAKAPRHPNGGEVTNTDGAEQPLGIVKTLSDSGEKNLHSASPDYVPGSYEEIQSKLSDAIWPKLLEMTGLEKYDLSTWVAATFADSAVVCAYDWSRSETKCYEVTWGMKDGTLALGEEFKEVEIRTTVVERSLKGLTKPIRPNPDESGQTETPENTEKTVNADVSGHNPDESGKDSGKPKQFRQKRQDPLVGILKALV